MPRFPTWDGPVCVPCRCWRCTERCCRADGYHVVGVDVVPANHLVRYLQRLRLTRLDAETIEAASRAVLARFDVSRCPA